MGRWPLEGPLPEAVRPWGGIFLASVPDAGTILSARPCLPSWRVRNRPDPGGNYLRRLHPGFLVSGGLPSPCLGSRTPPLLLAAPRSHTPFPQAELSCSTAPREPPACSICLERPRGAHLAGLWPRLLPAVLQHPPRAWLRAPLLPRVPQDLQAEGRTAGPGERMRLLLQRPLPVAALQVPTWTWKEGWSGRRCARWR